jgi:hypothetical protein
MLSRIVRAAAPRLAFPVVKMSAAAPAASLHIEKRLEELGMKLPAPSKPVASYVMVTRVGNMLYTGS